MSEKTLAIEEQMISKEWEEKYWNSKTSASTYIPYHEGHQRDLPSSSKSSGFPYSAAILATCILRRTDTMDFQACCHKEYQLYDLDAIHEHYLDSKYECDKRGHKETAKCCETVLSHFAKSCHKNLEFHKEQSINLKRSSFLAPFFSSLDQRPDISVSLKEEPTAALIVEIHSSPYEDTLRKTVITALDLLRLRRMYNDEVYKITAFSFPKFDIDQCVVKVVVTWKEFTFWYTLEPITIEKIKDEIVRAFDNLMSLANPSSKPREPVYDKVIMRLSEAELVTFEGENACQVPAKAAVIVRTDRYMYKLPIWSMEYKTLCLHISVLRNMPDFKGMRLEFSDMFFRYPRIKYDPMLPEEAKECTKEFYSKVHFILNEVHKKLGLAHLDIRLENICFNTNFEPVFIDFDRCQLVMQPGVPDEYHGTSCMYEISKGGIEHDWMQIGWIIDWILADNNDHDYHARTELHPSLSQSKTLQELIKGVPVHPDIFKEDDVLDAAGSGDSTITEVLTRRSL